MLKIEVRGVELMGTDVKKGEPWPHPHLVPEFLLMDP
jgi:hypothetical protein